VFVMVFIMQTQFGLERRLEKDFVFCLSITKSYTLGGPWN
jgi:hypothetical protein